MMTIRGKVIEGKKRGKDLGFPTANIRIHKHIEEGIYLARVKVPNIVIPAKVGDARQGTGIHSNEKKPGSRIKSGMTVYNALTFIGKAITFHEKKVFAETYLLDFSGNLYGKYITISLLQKLRDNKKFDSVEELQKQMNEDVVNARKFFAPWC